MLRRFVLAIGILGSFCLTSVNAQRAIPGLRAATVRQQESVLRFAQAEDARSGVQSELPANAHPTTKLATPDLLDWEPTGLGPPKTGETLSRWEAFVEKGRVAFELSCTTCHEAEQALEETKSYQEWLDVIQEMSEKDDAEIAEEDFTSIATFLASRGPKQATAQKPRLPERETTPNLSPLARAGQTAFYKSCVKCHDANRALVVKQTFREWIDTVDEMAAKTGAEIDDRDTIPIATFLSERGDDQIPEAADANFNERSESEDSQDDEPSTSSSELAEAGRAAFYKSCIECHEAERALSVKKSFRDWMTTIREMAEKEDAEIAPSDFRAIAIFLSSRSSEDVQASAKESDNDSGDDDQTPDKSRTFDAALVAAGRAAFNKSCLKCHDAARSLSKSKSLSGWRATVRRMAAKDGADVRPGDFEAIATYLASESSGGGGDDESAESVSPWSFSTTLSTLERVSSDPIENPGFFVDAWVGADWQSDGPLRATVTACTSCHSDRNSGKGFTFELVEASATLDLKKLFANPHKSSQQPTEKASPHVNDSPVSTNADLKLGRFVVPFGAYSAMSHPGSYRTVTNPLMFNMGRRINAGGPFQPVLPAPYSDEGLNLHLKLREYCDRSYTIDLFAVNGLQGNAGGVNFNLSRSYSDNNRSPAVGGRFTLGNPRFRLGASGMSGKMQSEGSPVLDYHLVGADATINAEKLRAYFEYAFRRDENGTPDSNEIDGYIFELEWKARERLSLLTRYDTLEQQISSAGNMSTERFTWGVNLSLQNAGLLLLNHEHWMFPDASDVDVIGARWVTAF